LLTLLRSQLFWLPTSSSLSVFWNIGSFLAIIIGFQVLRGLLLTLYYVADMLISFNSVSYLIFEVNYGFFIRIIHMNGASVLFTFLYLHLFKNITLGSWKLNGPWLRGIIIIIILIGVAFIGYSLIISQIRYWAVVVITSLVSVLPYIGSEVLVWIWGGFSVGNGVLKLFFTIHFVLPFLILVFIVIHLFSLHRRGRRTSLGYSGDLLKYGFNPIYSVKDSYSVFWLFIFLFFILLFPYILGDVELFIKRNNLRSPVHIVPEWYYCTFYAILRSIPNKVLGVLAMGLTLMELLFMCFYGRKPYSVNSYFKYFITSLFIINFIFLGWLGIAVAEDPYVLLSFIFIINYFVFLIFIILRI